MDCKVCELKQRQFYCATCLRTHVHDIQQQTAYFAQDRDEHIQRANKALADTMTPNRLTRAELAARQQSVDELIGGLARMRKDNERKRDRLRALRESLAARRRTLAAAPSSPRFPPPSSISPSPSQDSNQAPTPTAGPVPDALAQLSAHIARARQGLVAELVEVFNIVEVGGRPAVQVGAGGAVGTGGGQGGAGMYGPGAHGAGRGLVKKGEWTIGGLVLPVPGDMRRYPPDHINAVLTYTIHFVGLLAFYLGVKLPFEIVWTGPVASDKSSSHSDNGSISSKGSSSKGSKSRNAAANAAGMGKLGVGVPWVGAVRGGEGGGWARWYNKHPLHVSASSMPLPPPPSAMPPGPSRRHTASPSIDGASESMTASILASLPPSLANLGRGATYGTPSSNQSLTDAASPTSGSPTVSNQVLPATQAQQQSSFTTALAMLLFNAAWLAHTQGVDVSLASAGDVLANLWAVCCSGELGRRSHETHPFLPLPTPPSFHLDFAQLLQATAANPNSTRLRSAQAGFSREGSGATKAKGTKGGGWETERIDEEDGWDLVEDDI
ncbi:hypothetical protein D9619_011005 [Psilocybe cf. subviscida]|uniref:Autophagy-related protein 14 n=1 Tax=Psilocybe cf. subviscida TaxID=2480587 RepID=A0A8H5B8R2_9AGAR|nr:hypothetical protein D9619_011005 [Psilocybe cf. subviscida]